METETGKQYHVKLRLHNDIYTTTLYGYMIDDLQYKGVKSSVIPSLTAAEKTGIAVGKFKYPLEFMSVEQMEKEYEQMEVQVGNLNFYNNMSLSNKCIC